jgi:nucleotide-binding universal stress UspA family protein
MTRILVAVDGSHASLDALDAVARAFRPDDVVIVVAVQPPEDVAPSPFVLRPPDAAADAARARDLLGEQGVPASTVVLHGRPGPAVCELARTLEADLIVVGTGDWRGPARVPLGSEAHHIVTHAACDVLVARPRRRGVVAGAFPPAALAAR